MSDHYALILGASSGFGKSIALALAKKGVNIFGVHLDRASTMPDVNKLIGDLKNTGVEVNYYNVNAADPKRREDVISNISNTVKNNDKAFIKIFIHSLAFGTLKPFISENKDDEINQKQIEMTLDVMANSLVYWTQDLYHNDLIRRGSKIFGMTSSGGSRQIAFYGAVSAAKACLESYIRQLAMELGSKGISVNALCAGVTDTPALQKIPNAQEIIKNALQRNPESRLTRPDEIAEFVAHNYQTDSHWMTGNIIHIDGGESIVEL